jgi:hypothetical protein
VELTGQLHTYLDGEVVELIRDFIEWGGGILGVDHQFRGCGLCGFDTRGFLLCLPSGRLSGCCRFWIGLLRPSRFPGGCHFRLRGCLCDRLRRVFRIWWSGGGLDKTPPSEDVVPVLAQIRLLGRCTGPFCGAGSALSDTLKRSLCNGCLRLFPLYTAAVTRRVVATAAKARGCSLGVEHPPERWEPPKASLRGAYPQLHCV